MRCTALQPTCELNHRLHAQVRRLVSLCKEPCAKNPLQRTPYRGTWIELQLTDAIRSWACFHEGRRLEAPQLLFPNPVWPNPSSSLLGMQAETNCLIYWKKLVGAARKAPQKNNSLKEGNPRGPSVSRQLRDGTCDYTFLFYSDPGGCSILV